MCLIAFFWQPGLERPLVMAANRDEFHARPTAALGWWAWPAGPLAGRDLEAGGTWMASDRRGRFAAVTNFRDGRAPSGQRSRGELPLAWLETGESALEFARDLYDRRASYGPFTLLAGDYRELVVVGTHQPPEPVSPGIHALSNHNLDAPWPKSIAAVRRLEAWQANDSGNLDALIGLLNDRTPAPADELPETGLEREFERLVSAPFVVSPRYGTRASTVLVLGPRACMAERTFDAAGRATGEIRFCFSPEVR